MEQVALFGLGNMGAVTGSKSHTNSGELFFLVGGERIAFDRVCSTKRWSRDSVSWISPRSSSRYTH